MTNMTRLGIFVLGLVLLCSCSSVAGDDGLLQSGSAPDENIRSVQQPAIILSACSAGYPPQQTHLQKQLDDKLVIPAEFVDATGRGAFSVQDHPLAQHWNILKAPPTAVSSPTAPFATYSLNFKQTGNYSLWVRARGLSSGENSIFVPTDFGQNPSQVAHIPDTNTWGWTKMGNYNVQTTGSKKFKIGHREQNTEIDTLVFVLGDPSNPNAVLDGYAGYLEAENAVLSNVTIEPMTSASGGHRIGGFKSVGDSLKFSAVPAGRINIRYYLNSDSTYQGLGRQASVYLKGVSTENAWKDVAMAHFPVTGSNSTWDTTFVYLPPGGGEVRFQIDADDYTANQGDYSAFLDYISFADGGFGCQADSANALRDAVDKESLWDTVVLPKSDCATPNGWYDNLDIVVGKSGSADRPFSLRAFVAGEVHLTGDSSVTVPGSHVVVDGLAFFGGTETEFTEDSVVSVTGSYNRLTNTTIIGHNLKNPASDVNSDWVYVSGQHNRIDHNHFEHKSFKGQSLRGDKKREDGGADIVIDHNYFGPRPHSSGTNQWEAITVGEEPPRVAHHVLKYNLFEDASGAQEPEVVSIKHSGAYIYYNTFKNNQGHLTLRWSHGAHIEGNVFRDSVFADHSGLGIRVFGADHTIINNYFHNMDAGLWIPAVQTTDPPCYLPVERLIVAHNTFAATSPAINFQHYDGCEGGTWVRATKIVVANNHVGDRAANWPVEPVDMPPLPEHKPQDVRWFSNYAAIDAPQLPDWQVFKVDMATGSDSLLRGFGPASATSAADINNALSNEWPECPELKYDVDGNVRGNPSRVGADAPAPIGNVIAPQDRDPEGLWARMVGPAWGRLFDEPSYDDLYCPGEQ